MKKQLFLAAMMLMMGTAAWAQGNIALPQPDMNMLKMNLGDALKMRRSGRSYDASREISAAQLSTLLWAACGVSDPASGKITAPSAVNMQDIKVYVCTKDGACLYDAQKNELVTVTTKDLRAALADRQEFAKDAPVNLLLVSNQEGRQRKSDRWGKVDSGYVSQIIYLACTAMRLQTVARGTMDVETVRRELGLPEGVDILLNHPVAYGK